MSDSQDATIKLEELVYAFLVLVEVKSRTTQKKLPEIIEDVMGYNREDGLVAVQNVSTNSLKRLQKAQKAVNTFSNLFASETMRNLLGEDAETIQAELTRIYHVYEHNGADLDQDIAEKVANRILNP